MKEYIVQKIKTSDFNLKQTLECGQCFHYDLVYEAETDDPAECCYEYHLTAYDKLLKVRQEGRTLLFLNTTEEDVKKIWVPYFDLNRDYGVIKEAIIRADPRLEEVIRKYYGIHILNQEFIETLMSFIISQNKSIPQIRKLVNTISCRYGKKLGCLNDKSGEPREYYGFPDKEHLKMISEQEFRDMKTGFRAPYLKDAAQKLCSGNICEENLKKMDYYSAREQLKQIRGVGDKVANCVLLFGLGFRNAFPVDVWIRKIMEEMYFQKKTDLKSIEKLGMEKFGEYSGYAQQYLFIYARNKNSKKVLAKASTME